MSMHGSALMFASDEQLELLRSETQVYFDATFKILPTVFYQLFTLFAPFTDAAFPAVQGAPIKTIPLEKILFFQPWQY